jgi:hypothetical protein
VRSGCGVLLNSPVTLLLRHRTTLLGAPRSVLGLLEVLLHKVGGKSETNGTK